MSSFEDRGLIIKSRAHGEGALIVTCLTEGHGVRSGYVHAGRLSKHLRAVLQPGNQVHLTWYGQNDGDLGRFEIEGEDQISALILDDKLRLLALQSVCAVLDQSVGERDHHPGLYEGTSVWFESLKGELWAPLLVLWELQLLKTLGFGLSLDQCAVSGRTDDLTFVSPKSGAAVCSEHAEPYQHKLLPLPSFLCGGDDWGDEDIAKGLRLSGYFLFHRVLDPLSRSIPEARDRLYSQFLPPDTPLPEGGSEVMT